MLLIYNFKLSNYMEADVDSNNFFWAFLWSLLGVSLCYGAKNFFINILEFNIYSNLEKVIQKSLLHEHLLMKLENTNIQRVSHNVLSKV